MSSSIDIVLKNIRREMDLRQWTQADLAAASGVHRVGINRILNSHNDLMLGTLEKIADAFGKRPTDLLRVETQASETDSLASLAGVPVDVLMLLPQCQDWDLLRQTLRVLAKRGDKKSKTSS